MIQFRPSFHILFRLPQKLAGMLPGLLLGLLLACTLLPAYSADALTAALAPTAADIDNTLDSVRKDITSIQLALQDKQDDATLIKLRATALDAAAKADSIATAQAPALTSVNARLAELGTPTAATKETADIVSQRAQLDKSRSKLDAQLKLANLLSVEAEQVAAQVSTMRRTRFQERLGERTASILAPAFWTELRDDFTQDRTRIAGLFKQMGKAAQATPLTVWAILAVIIAGLIALRIYAGYYLIRLTATKVPPGRLRRSLHAVTLVALAAATPASIVFALLTGLRWSTDLPEDTDTFLFSLLGLVSFGGYVYGLGYALLLPDRHSWRLLPLSDALTRRMRGFPPTLGIVLVVVWFSERLSVLIDAGLATAVAINCLSALLLSLTITFWLLRGARKWRKLRAESPMDQPTHAIWIRAIIVVQWLLLGLSLLSLLLGYVALGSFVVKQVVWTLIVLSSCYLFTVLIDDLCIAVGSSVNDANEAKDNQDKKDNKDAAVTAPQARDQIAVLLSGALRLVLLLIALMLLAAPFGEGPTELLHRADKLHDGIQIGEIAIKPAAVLQALVVLGLALIAIRYIKRWLQTRYLPTTRLDTGMQASASTLFGYAGGVLAVALAMSAIGIGLERIAWVASALSVGIGFGLQAVVQNFVSGIILLAERPVKVGDWVSLSGVEGDIRRINVRATEIQMGDRSTVIVPNSEFITKIVRNVTHTNPLGLVQLKLPLPLDTDAEQARELLLAAFREHATLLDDPAPNVQLDGIDGANLIFNATGFVSSPRLAYGARSELLFVVLARLREAGISISKQPTMLLNNPLQPATAVAPSNEESSVEAVVVSPVAAAPASAPVTQNQPGQQTMPMPPHT